MLVVLISLAATGCTRSIEVRLGEPVTLNDVSYTVAESRSQGQYVVPLLGQSLDAGPDATFVVVRVEAVNRGRRTSALSPRLFELQTSEGLRYRPDTLGMAAQIASEDAQGGALERSPRGAILRPRIPVSYSLVFRLPYHVARGSLALVIHGPAFFRETEAIVVLR